ncbi:hypothetical protein [Actinophytocola sp.]|uniref:hypothetical protein n=1 Tax=Actinophytocola sp. TaxID=1872138 RepID=UPI003C7644CF
MTTLAVVYGGPRTAPRPAAQPTVLATGVNLYGLDAHDGTIVQDGAVFYLYGTRYGCGFTWRQPNTPFCGFGVWTASAVTGPWTFQRLLFTAASQNPWNGQSWQYTCGSDGAGCFNPRMVKRASDGVWMLWFNAPGDYNRTGANAYYVMGCNSPTGPCGAAAGAPYGSTHKPAMHICYGNGDHSIVVDGTTGYIMCTRVNQTIAIERLDRWWANGDGTGAANVAGLTQVESPGAWRAADGKWILTYSDINCGYCAANATGYAVADTPRGPFTAPGNVGVSAPERARRDISASSCGGQPRTVVTLNGQPYQWIDLWVGTTNETIAGIHLEPLITNPPYLPPANGRVQPGGILPFTCV